MRNHLIRILLGLIAGTPLYADSSFDSGSVAWAGNTGWISLRHDQPSSPEGVAIGESFAWGYAWSANTGWIHWGDGSPDNGYSYSNTGADHGVNHDGAGNLSGYAWAANTGWIHFGWASPTDPNRPRFNLLTGSCSGYAWSPNTGWIALGASGLTVKTLICPDTDLDGIADAWEMRHAGNLTQMNAITDWDSDGQSDAAEYGADTDPDDDTQYFEVATHAYSAGFSKATLSLTTMPTRVYRIEISKDVGQADPWLDSDAGVFLSNGVLTSQSISIPDPGESFYSFRGVTLRPLSP